MGIRILGIGGEPATGKSSLMTRLFPGLPSTPMQKVRLLRYHELLWRGRTVYVMGDYSGEIEHRGHFFGGTDKLSMAVLPEFLSVLRVWSIEKQMEGSVVVFEGDRLFTRKTFEAIEEMKEEYPTRERLSGLFIVLTVSEEEKKRRHIQRGDTQEASWLQGRATKVSRLCAAFPEIEQRPNETEAHCKVNKVLIESWLEGNQK